MVGKNENKKTSVVGAESNYLIKTHAARHNYFQMFFESEQNWYQSCAKLGGLKGMTEVYVCPQNVS